MSDDTIEQRARAFAEKPENDCAVVDDLLAAFARAEVVRHRTWSGCPCLHTTPCDPHCTCANPLHSFGCRRCARYGSAEQRREAAEYLARLIDDGASAVARERERCARVCDEIADEQMRLHDKVSTDIDKRRFMQGEGIAIDLAEAIRRGEG